MRTLSTLCFLFFIASFIQAQHFAPPMNTFSTKKVSYVHLDDGEVVKGNMKSWDFKKGLIKKIKIKDANDTKQKMRPDVISHMYIPPSGLEKLQKSVDAAFTITKWQTVDIDKDIIDKGYVYYEKTEVRIKKKTFTLMVQLLNPTFNKVFSVYQDPRANETMSIGIGPLKLGGVPKEVFIRKKGDKVAFHYHKKNYKDDFKRLFGDAPEMIKKYGDNPAWEKLDTHLWEYTQSKN